jgi:ribosome modulation factor
MPEFEPVVTASDLQWLQALQQADMAHGYAAGLAGLPEPLSSAFSRAYWHGWRTGMADAEHMPAQPDQRELYAAVQRADAAAEVEPWIFTTDRFPPQ